ncbi:MAG: methyl-accepting chemotaxis protein [Gammaproteobacteria bacterium]
MHNPSVAVGLIKRFSAFAPILVAIALSSEVASVWVIVAGVVASLAVVAWQALNESRSIEELSRVEEINRSLAVIEFTTDGIIVDANQRFLDMMGYTLDEMKGQHHSMIVDEEYRDSVEYAQFWETLRRGEFQVAQYRRIAKDGSVRWVNASYNPTRTALGAPGRIVKLATDITLERSLTSENSMIRSALDCSKSSVMLADNDFNIAYLNDAARTLFQDMESDLRKELTNFRASELLHNSIDVFHKNALHQRRMLEGLKSTHVTDVGIGGRTVRIVATPVVTGDGERLGTVVDWTDRTAEVKTEKDMENVVAAASAGQLDARIDLEEKSGSMLRLSKGVNQLLDVSQNVISEVMRVFSAMSKGDLAHTIDGQYQGDFEQLKNDANTTISRLVDVVRNIADAVEPVRTGAHEIAQGNMNLSQRTEQQVLSLEQTASRMKQLTATVTTNAGNAADASDMARTARQEAEEGGRVVDQTVAAMSEINASSQTISDIVGVIDEIAFQTNLLALNAAVEAARAGEQGRGFAVVASEVRSLAGRSASSAKEIKDLIDDSNRKVSEGSRLVNESGEVLSRIVEGVHRVTDIVGEIAAASRAQSEGIQEVNLAISSMDEFTQQNAAMVEEASAASRSMGDQANGLQELVEFFSIENVREQPGQPVDRRTDPNRPWSAASATTYANNQTGEASRRQAS